MPPAAPLASPAPLPSALPVVSRAYHEFYRTPRLRWWKPLVALVGVGIAGFLAAMILGTAFIAIAVALGETTWEQLMAMGTGGPMPVTPMIFLGNNLCMAALILLALLTHRLVFGQRFGWLHSIQGRFRWRLLGRFLLVALPFFLVWYIGEMLVSGADFSELRVDGHTVPMILIILLTTPLQCAGEEYALRGLVPRCVGAWFPHRAVGFVVATIVSSVIFMLLHGAGDPWLNVFYLCFAVAASVLVWRTGGLEAAIALHVVNNMIAMMTLPFQDMTGLFDREAGVGSPLGLIQIVCIVAVAATMWWQAKRLGLPTQAAPGFAPVRLDPIRGLAWLRERLAARPGRTLVGVDGVSGSGKTTFANELARTLAHSVAVIRISMDDFLNPQAVRYARGRTSPEGYYEDSYDRARFRADVLDPLGPGGSGRYRRAAYHLATETPVEAPWEDAPGNAVVIVDGLFLLRDEFWQAPGQSAWDLSVWMDVPIDEAYRRMAGRDGRPSDLGDPSNARYLGGETLYVHSCDPAARANLVVDNSVTYGGVG